MGNRTYNFSFCIIDFHSFLYNSTCFSISLLSVILLSYLLYFSFCLIIFCISISNFLLFLHQYLIIYMLPFYLCPEANWNSLFLDLSIELIYQKSVIIICIILPILFCKNILLILVSPFIPFIDMIFDLRISPLLTLNKLPVSTSVIPCPNAPK